jgi:hypothetical protein
LDDFWPKVLKLRVELKEVFRREDRVFPESIEQGVVDCLRKTTEIFSTLVEESMHCGGMPVDCQDVMRLFLRQVERLEDRDRFTQQTDRLKGLLERYEAEPYTVEYLGRAEHERQKLMGTSDLQYRIVRMAELRRVSMADVEAYAEKIAYLEGEQEAAQRSVPEAPLEPLKQPLVFSDDKPRRGSLADEFPLASAGSAIRRVGSVNCTV